MSRFKFVKKESGEYEYIEHPTHYNKEGRKECIEEMIDLYGIEATINFCTLNAYKYRYRVGGKPNEDEQRELQKADWYESKAEELRKRGAE